jgi:hypothetical protein
VNRIDPDGMQDEPIFRITVWEPLGWTFPSPIVTKLLSGGSGPPFVDAVDEGYSNGDGGSADFGGGFVGPRPQGFISVSNPSKTGPQQDRISTVLNWINTNVDDQCAKWLGGLGDAIESLLGDSTDDRTVLIGHGAFNGSAVSAFVGNHPSQTDIPDGYAITVNDTGLFFKSISGFTAGGYKGGTSQAQVFILLHELGHWLNASGFQSDFQNSAAGLANDNLVKQNCGKTINAAKNIPQHLISFVYNVGADNVCGRGKSGSAATGSNPGRDLSARS